jgi:cytochrome c-type biogenesis protein CcmH/NrfF
VRGSRRRRATIAVAVLLAASTFAGAAVAASRPSLPVIERQVMCVTCKIPLNVAQSLQADRERAFIRELIQQGRDEATIKRALVGQYGPAVLGLPSTHGFDASAYLVPLLVVIALAGLLLALLPRWRRHARAQAAAGAAGASAAALPETDAARLDADLARFD